MKILFGFLCCLHILNVFWFWLMIKGVIRRFSMKKEDRNNKIYVKVD